MDVSEISEFNFFRNAKMSLNFREEIEVRKLKNFQKSHRIPFDVSESSARFIGSLVRNDLEDKFTEMQKKIRSAFGLRRKEIEVHIDEFGFAALETKKLRYVEKYEQNPKSPELVATEKCLDEIDDLNIVTNSDFDSVFGAAFTSLDFDFDITLDVEQLIDAFEDLDDNRLKLDYNLNATECALSVASGKEKLLITDSRIQVISWLPTSGMRLFNEAANFQIILAEVFRDADMM